MENTYHILTTFYIDFLYKVIFSPLNPTCFYHKPAPSYRLCFATFKYTSLPLHIHTLTQSASTH